jgi:hypothetical protein
VRRPLVTVINITLGLAAAAVLGNAILGPGAHQAPASAAPLAGSVGSHHTVPLSSTLPLSTTLVTQPTLTTLTTAPATTAPGISTPATTHPLTTLPAPKVTTTTRPRSVPLPTYPYPVYTGPTVTLRTTTTTSTTIAAIGNRLPVTPSTLPFSTKSQSAHVSPVFAALSGAGFLVAFVIMAVTFVLTRPGRKL